MNISFAKNSWEPQDWMQVQCPLGRGEGLWIQKEDCIVNYTPENAAPEDLCEEGRYVADTFASMLFKRRFNSTVRAASTMLFEHRMAPLMFVTNEIDGFAKVPVLGERYEVVLYDKGINIWEHCRHNDKIKYHRKLFFDKPLLAKQKYTLEITVNPDRKELTVKLGETCFTVHTPLVGSEYYIGIMGCEGVNRFYNFEVTDYDQKN